jgi:SET domain-containing protein
MLIIKTKLDKSSIHGIGLFTLEKIEKGQVIAELSEFDIKIKKDDVPQKHIEMFEFYFGVEKDCYQTYFDNMRFMNHSDYPNCIDAKNGMCIAIKDIEIGEELTCDYSFFCNLWENID